MVGTIKYCCMNTNYRESSKNTCLCRFLDTLSNCRNVFLRNCTADNLGIKLVKFLAICIHRLKAHLTVTILSTSTRLLCILAVNLDRLGDCFLICNLWSTYIRLNLKLTKQSINNNLQMKLTHSGDNGLSCLLIGMCAESRILLCKLSQCLTHFALTCFCLRLNSQLNNRLRELHRLKNNRMLIITDGITCRCKLKANSCSNISRIYLIKFLSLVCMHLQNTSDTLLLVLCCI